MWGVARLGASKLRNCCSRARAINSRFSEVKPFHTTSALAIKEIQQVESNGEITVKGVTKPSSRQPYLIRVDENVSKEECTSCPICRLGQGIEIRHTDVLILHQFTSSDGRILPRNVTGLCYDQYKRMKYLIVMSRHAGLLPKRLPDGSIDPTESAGWRANNKYYEEYVIDDFILGGRKKA